MEKCEYRVPTLRGFICTVQLNGKDPSDVGCNRICTNTLEVINALHDEFFKVNVEEREFYSIRDKIVDDLVYIMDKIVQLRYFEADEHIISKIKSVRDFVKSTKESVDKMLENFKYT